jgi:hypothetical protein
MFWIVFTRRTVRHLLRNKKKLQFANRVNFCVSCAAHSKEQFTHAALVYWSPHFIRTVVTVRKELDSTCCSDTI